MCPELNQYIRKSNEFLFTPSNVVYVYKYMYVFCITSSPPTPRTDTWTSPTQSPVTSVGKSIQYTRTFVHARVRTHIIQI